MKEYHRLRCLFHKTNTREREGLSGSFLLFGCWLTPSLWLSFVSLVYYSSLMNATTQVLSGQSLDEEEHNLLSRLKAQCHLYSLQDAADGTFSTLICFGVEGLFNEHIVRARKRSTFQDDTHSQQFCIFVCFKSFTLFFFKVRIYRKWYSPNFLLIRVGVERIWVCSIILWKCFFIPCFRICPIVINGNE